MEEFQSAKGQKPALHEGGYGIDLSELKFDFKPFFKVEGVEAPGPGFEAGTVAPPTEAPPFEEIRLGLAEFLRETESRFFQNIDPDIRLVFNADSIGLNEALSHASHTHNNSATGMMDSPRADSKEMGSLTICLNKLSFLDLMEDFDNDASGSERRFDASETQQRECATFDMKSVSLSKLVG
jgi:hypothetical protein